MAFCFGAFIEGCAGFGAPVAIAGAFMIGLGFKPFQAAALNLIANTSPVAWGAIGTPVHTLAAVTALNESDLVSFEVIELEKAHLIRWPCSHGPVGRHQCDAV